MMNLYIKFLVFFSIIMFLLGAGLIWFGLNGKITENTTVSVSTQSAQVAGIDGEKAVVIKVVDGDTIDVEINGQNFVVRFIGIDTPETVDPRRPVGCFGKEASGKTKELLSGKQVILQKDVSDTDKYNRLLRYVFLPLDSGQMLFVNDYLVRTGYAKVITYPPDVKYSKQFLEAQIEARQKNLGLWDKCK